MLHDTPSSFRDLKRQALELLEWTLDDMSPEQPDRKLYFKCGFEREGHFLPEKLPAAERFEHHLWKQQRQSDMEKYAAAMHKLLSKDPDLLKIYADHAGTFMLEGVGKAVGLVQATAACERISKRMLEVAPELKLSSAAFGSLAADDVIDRIAKEGRSAGIQRFIHTAFENYHHEVFATKLSEKTLIGRGQHCNLSVWAGDKNLFIRQSSADGGCDLVNHAAAKALEWLPHMFLPCRKGNYWRIQSAGKFSLGKFSAGDLQSPKHSHILRHTADSRGRSWNPDPGSFRLEFRQGASEADPYDLSLASAVPLVKTCEEILGKDESGKVALNQNGGVTLLEEHPFPQGKGYDKPVPQNEDEAKALFNVEKNPYFEYLDELAQRKIQRLEQRNRDKPGFVHEEELRNAEKLRNIGTRLHVGYCREYGMKSVMPGAESFMQVA